MRSWDKRSVNAGSTVYLNALPGFSGVVRQNVTHQAVNIAKKPEEKDALFHSIKDILYPEIYASSTFCYAPG